MAKRRKHAQAPSLFGASEFQDMPKFVPPPMPEPPPVVAEEVHAPPPSHGRLIDTDSFDSSLDNNSPDIVRSRSGMPRDERRIAACMAEVEFARREAERFRRLSISAEKGDSVAAKLGPPRAEDRVAWQRYLQGSWNGEHQPQPEGMNQFVAYLNAISNMSSALFRLACATGDVSVLTSRKSDVRH